LVHRHLVNGQDYGVIKGTNKPTLLKPGGEKVMRLLHLRDIYTIEQSHEDFSAPLFFYRMKCQLVYVPTGEVVTEGVGCCSSMEGKYRWRWLTEEDLPIGFDKKTAVRRSQGRWTPAFKLPPGADTSKMQKKTIETKLGKKLAMYRVVALEYRVDNDDVCAQQNTILKMGKKRAMIDAVLGAARLSEIFSQDLEDEGEIEEEAEAEAPEMPEDVPEMAEAIVGTHEGAKTAQGASCPAKGPVKPPMRKEPVKSDGRPARTEPKAAPAVAKAEPVKAAEGAAGHDPSRIRTLGDLFNTCYREFKLDRPAVLSELGVNSAEDITMTPAEAYSLIVGVYAGPPK
ncbi:MAG: hypothetical protein PHQ43_15645, partial [Dehalococcoidales bacterium]|nr:hypothetical protein [Dehalococcoidales bacterium]